MTKEDELKMKENEVLTQEDKILATIGLFKGGPRSVEETVKEVRKLAFKESYRFYISNVSSIEIDFKGVLTKVAFKIPTYCTYLTHKTKLSLIWDINRTS